MKRLAILLAVLSLAACQNVRQVPAAAPASIASAPPSGTFDNHEQVWLAHEAASAGPAPPHVVVTIDPTRERDWSVWHVRLDANPPLDATFAMHRVADAAGAPALVPNRALATPSPPAAFDPKQWTPLDACALHARAGAKDGLGLAADVAACTAIAPGIGADAALLPIAVGPDGEWLRVRLYADQARGADAREDLREVRWFGGWAAINGGGPKAAANSTDWHMNRKIRIGSEGGTFALRWRDASPSGYSLRLERLVYREGNVPVLKLSVVDDSDGRSLAYAWANPEATRIGINLGWVQVGLDLEAAPAK